MSNEPRATIEEMLAVREKQGGLLPADAQSIRLLLDEIDRLRSPLMTTQSHDTPDRLAALRAVSTEAGDRLLARNAGRDRAIVEWLTNDIRAIEQEEFDKVLVAVRAALARRMNALREAYEALREIGCIAASGEASTGQQCYACRARDHAAAALAESEPGRSAYGWVAAVRAGEGLDVETLHYALEAVDPVAFGRDGTTALSREDIDHFLYAKAIAREYVRLRATPTEEPT
jgi:hypothetical protein